MSVLRHKARPGATRLNSIKQVQQAKILTYGTPVIIHQVWAREMICKKYRNYNQ